MTLSDERLAQIEQRANAATPGPWRTMEDSMSVFESNAYREVASAYENPHDVDFIAEARDAVPQLVDEVRRLRAANDALRLALVRQEVER